jgi:hypothetical protein
MFSLQVVDRCEAFLEKGGYVVLESVNGVPVCLRCKQHRPQDKPQADPARLRSDRSLQDTCTGGKHKASGEG